MAKAKKNDENDAAIEEMPQPPPTTTAADKPKRVVKRKSLWLAVPMGREPQTTENGDAAEAPLKYALYKCASKGEVLKILSKLGINVTSDSASEIRLFRADPIPLRLSTQVSFNF
jgi:hypothetical protein